MVKGLKILCLAGFGAQLLAGNLVHAVEQGQLEDLRQIEVPLQDVGLISERSSFHAAGAAALPGVLQALAGVHQFLDDRLRVVEGGLSPAFPGNLAGPLQKFPGIFPADLHIGVGLNQLEVIHAVQDDVRHLVDPVLPLRSDAAGIDVGEIRVGAALLEGDAHLRRSRLIVELYPQALHQLLGLVPGEDARLDIPFIEGPQVLVKVSGGVGVPRIELRSHRQVGKPVGLDGLIEGFRLTGRHHVAVGGNLQQLLFPLFIGAPGGHFPGKLPIALAQDHDGVAGDEHGVELVPLVQSIRIALVVQLGQGRPDVLLVVEISLLVELGGAHRVAGAPLLHELGEDAGLIGVLPLLGHAVQDPAAHGPVLPVGDDLLLLDVQVLLRDGEVAPRPVVHVAHVLQGVAAQLREGGGGLGTGPLLPHDQLAFADVQGLMGEDMLQRQGPQLRHGHPALVHLVGLRLQDGPLHVDMGLGLHAQPSQPADALVHAPLLSLRHWSNLLYECLSIRPAGTCPPPAPATGPPAGPCPPGHRFFPAFHTCPARSRGISADSPGRRGYFPP